MSWLARILGGRLRHRAPPITNWSIYWTRTRLVIPHDLKVRTGGSLDVEPYRVLDPADPELSTKLRAILAGENTRVVASWPEEDRRANTRFLATTGVRSWTALYRDGRYWRVLRTEGRFSVNCFKPPAKGRGLELDKFASAAIERDMSLEDAVAVLIAEIAAR